MNKLILSFIAALLFTGIALNSDPCEKQVIGQFVSFHKKPDDENLYGKIITLSNQDSTIMIHQQDSAILASIKGQPHCNLPTKVPYNANYYVLYFIGFFIAVFIALRKFAT